MPIPPSSFAALAGASVLLNLSAIQRHDRESAITGMSWLAGKSARCLAAYLYTSAGRGESTTDLAWDGQASICENGNVLAESTRFSREPQLITSDIDLERLSEERMRQESFGQNVLRERGRLGDFRTIRCAVSPPHQGRLLPQRVYERFPYVPSEVLRTGTSVAARFTNPGAGLVKRLRRPAIEGGDRDFGRPGFHACAAGVRSGHGPA